MNKQQESHGFGNVKTVLILGPHPDDGEFSSAGTICKMIEYGIEVHYAVFSICEQSVPKGLPEDIIQQELEQAAKFLGINSEHLYIFGYPVRKFPQYRQEILEDMVEMNKKIKPDLVFIPSSTDIHQDHNTIHMEGLRAFKSAMVVGYEMPWNNFNFLSNLYIVLEKRHLEKKVETLKCYKSQTFRYYTSEDFIMSLAKVRGTQIKEEYAEAFEILRWKIK